MTVRGNPKFRMNIHEMQVGDRGYTLCWALSYDFDGTPYLNTRYPVYQERRGTVKLPILRKGPGDADFIIDIRDVNYVWDKRDMSNYPDYFVRLETSLDQGIEDIMISEENGLLDETFSLDRLTNQLNKAVASENYELAAKLRDEINEFLGF